MMKWCQLFYATRIFIFRIGMKGKDYFGLREYVDGLRMITETMRSPIDGSWIIIVVLSILLLSKFHREHGQTTGRFFHLHRLHNYITIA